MTQLAQPQKSNLTTTEGGYEFSLLHSFGFDGKTYLLAMSDNSPGQIFIVEHKGHELSLVVDDQKLEQLRQHLDTIKDSWETIAVEDAEGKLHHFQIVRQLQHQGQTYLMGIAVDGNNQLAAFRTEGEALTLETDTSIVTELANRMKAYTSSVMSVSLETAPGETQELTVVGQIDIEGKLYVLAAGDDDSNVLTAFVQEGDELRPVIDPAEQALVQQQLQQLASQNA